MAKKACLRILAHALACGLVIYHFPTELRAQNAGDHLLHRSIIQVRERLIAAAKGADDDSMAVLVTKSQAELHSYKLDNNIAFGIANSPCQRSFEELSISAMYLATYVQPDRQTSGPVDRARDGREADRLWIDHRESLAECERYLGIPQSPQAGLEHITSVLPP